ncbi:Nucleoside-diphosphate-sugar epimerase [Jannaschia faecimaris]|uniref:Nucleoside-diphosphate-sugar epimerase n=1 Tax=Jannaschia faecimaris TaxID=1244108 RepID=A0A1H3IR34_9RHOB|nr:NAD-dependent epimerase/dehydratase family protein [Jannaschia faecimaris]SDY30067.1 Nucleoside-diphosphate-sugar epimerase [Jannaschia faecimaris]
MNTAATLPSGLAVTGSTGRIGRMLGRVWQGSDTAWLKRSDRIADRLDDRRCLVALAGVTRGDDTALAGNSDSALRALSAAEQAGVARVLIFSSAAIYGRADGPLTEAQAPTPISAYGMAKARMEDTVRAWADARPAGPEVVILRLGNVAGADALLSRTDATAPALDIFADGRSCRRSYMGPATLAQTLAALGRHPDRLPPILNISTPRTVEMAALLNTEGRAWVARRPRPDAIPEVRLNTSLLQDIIPLDQGSADPARIVREWREVCG